MKLYYSPGACSMAPHILIHEAELRCELAEVDLNKKSVNGEDFRKINPKGYVPALQTDTGKILTEAQVVLQYIADQSPDKNLIPNHGDEQRYSVLEWLAYISSEIHKGFKPLWSEQSSIEVKDAAKEALHRNFDFLSERLEESYITGSTYTAADAYLFTVLNWAKVHDIDLSAWPRLSSYLRRIAERDATQIAMKEEGLIS